MNFWKNPYWLKSGLFTLLERSSVQVFRFGSFFLLIRELSKEEFGIWTLFLVITTLLQEGQVGLIRKPLIRFLSVSDHPETRAQILTSSFVLNVLFSLLVGIFILSYGVIHPYLWDLPHLGKMLHIYLGTWFLFALLNQFCFLQQANLQFRGTFLTQIARTGFFFGYVCFGTFFSDLKFDLYSLVFWQMVSVGVGMVVAILTGWKYGKFATLPEKKWLLRLFRFGKYIAGTRIGLWVAKSIDQVMLGVIVSPVAVATYGITVRISNLVEVPTQAMADIVFPQSARKFHQKGTEAVKQIYEKSVGILLAMIVPGLLFIYLFPEFVLRFVAGDQYLEAVPLLQITLLYGLFMPFARQFGTIMDSLGKSRLNWYLILLSVGLNVLFNALFIPIHGMYGAAYGTLLMYALVFIAHQIILYREIDALPANILLYARKVYGNGFRLLLQKAGSRTR